MSDHSQSEISEQKEAARAQAKAVRQNFHKALTPAKQLAFYDVLSSKASQLISFAETKIGKARHEMVLASYWPMGSECDCRIMMQDLSKKGCEWALPALKGSGEALLFRRFALGDALQSAAFGTNEPMPDAPLCTPDVVLVPLLAFDGRGYRLGYGGGYYDRTLEALRHAKQVLAVGVAYACQEVKAVPMDQYDQLLDAILTEQEFRIFTNEKKL